MVNNIIEIRKAFSKTSNLNHQSPILCVLQEKKSISRTTQQHEEQKYKCSPISKERLLKIMKKRDIHNEIELSNISELIYITARNKELEINVQG